MVNDLPKAILFTLGPDYFLDLALDSVSRMNGFGSGFDCNYLIEVRFPRRPIATVTDPSIQLQMYNFPTIKFKNSYSVSLGDKDFHRNEPLSLPHYISLFEEPFPISFACVT